MLRFASFIPILQRAKLRNGEVRHFVQDAWGTGGKPCPASSVRAREGAGCGSVEAVSGP